MIRPFRETCELCKMFFDVHHNYNYLGCFGRGLNGIDWLQIRLFEIVYCIMSGSERLDIKEVKVQEKLVWRLRQQKSPRLYICAYLGESPERL